MTESTQKEPIIHDSSVSFETIADSKYTADKRRDAVRRAAAVFVPDEGRGSFKGPLFHTNTLSLHAHLSENGIPAEVPVSENDYNELALHADFVWVPTLLVALPYANNLLSFVASWMQIKLLKRFDRAVVNMQLFVENRDTGKRKGIKYEGPAKDFETTMKAAVESLNGLNDE